MISKTALHALKAVAILAETPDEFQGATSVAERIGAPPNYLGKLLQGLVQVGLLKSQKGMGGGFQLARNPSKITLYDVVEPIDHVSRWQGCFMGNESCSYDDPCELHFKWAGVRDAYMRMLAESTLNDIIAPRKPIRPET
jgi:Rrf2 family protein